MKNLWWISINPLVENVFLSYYNTLCLRTHHLSIHRRFE
nr:MAG TPA: hypothetical protein [Caudoviricetes sp.]